MTRSTGPTTASYAVFWQGSDSSSEDCWEGYLCIIQGESTFDDAYLRCSYYGVCDVTHEWFLDSLPVGLHAEFDPPEHQGLDTTTTIKFRADSNAPNVVKLAYLGLTPPPYVLDWPMQYWVKVLCSLKRQQCGRIEMFDLLQPADTTQPREVVSGAGPQAVLAGRPMHVGVRYVPGSGGPDSSDNFFLANIRWYLGYAAVEGASLGESGVVYPMPDWKLGYPGWGGVNDIEFYYGAAGTYNLRVTADIKHGAAAPPVPGEAVATYVAGPSIDSLWHTMRSVRVGVYDTLGETWLSLGQNLGPGTDGIEFIYAANQSPVDTGARVAVSQRATFKAQQIYKPTGQKVVKQLIPIQADGCALSHIAEIQASDANGHYHLYHLDSPGMELQDVFDSAKMQFVARTEFMFRPSGSQSIWASLGGITWQWKGWAAKATPGQPWALVRDSVWVDTTGNLWPTYDSVYHGGIDPDSCPPTTPPF